MQHSAANEKNATKGNIKPPIIAKGSKNNQTIEIKSRFGKVEVKESNCVSFRHGMLGIPSALTFCLTSLPGNNNDQFKLLQCLEDEALSFIVVPSQYDNQLLEKTDLDDACKVLNIESQNLIVLFIVTVHEENNNRKISVNAKAPVLIDVTTKAATQYVIQNDKYEIQHIIA